jgi:catechol 2,3-dioxygenase-like lactoylglutathione lyase family enzyme
MKRIGTLTRHLTHGYSAQSPSSNRDSRMPPRTGPKATFTDVANMSVEELQQRFGRSTADAVQFEGVNHVAFVSSDMAKTLWFWCEVLGFRLIKTLQLPNDGQHFFLDGGNNCAVAYFYFPNAPKHAPGIATINMQDMVQGKGYATAHGSVNHVAFNVPLNKLKEYRERVKQANVGMVSPILYHSDVAPSGYTPSRDENTVWESFYFAGPDGEWLEMTAQTDREFTPERDILHKPASGIH